MEWDLGAQGVALLGAMSLGFGVVAGLAAGGGVVRRAWALVVATLSCSVVGVLISEGLFGWATEEDLQPNVDGLSFDEVLLSGVLTCACVVVAVRLLARRRADDVSPGSGRARSPRTGR